MNCSSMSSLNRCAVLHRLLCGDLLRYGPSWAAVKSMLHHGFPAGWREIPALAPGMPPNPPPPHTLLFLLSFFFPSLSSPLPVHFFPFLKYIFPEEPPICRRGSVVPCSGLVGADCVRHRAAPGSPHRQHPCNPPAASTLPHKHNAMHKWIILFVSCYKLTFLSF